MATLPVRHVRNPRGAQGDYPAALAPILNDAGFAAARSEIATWPGYGPTPLRHLRGLAARSGLAAIAYKDEGSRFGLGSFKALGGPYAVLRAVQRKIAAETGNVPPSRALIEGECRAITADMTVTCATDGNHGRAVAWGARLFGCCAVIFTGNTVSEGRRAAIGRLGAEVARVAGSYDDAVRHAATEAARQGWTVISDTSYPGYTAIPRDVMHGYGVMIDEAIEQFVLPPSHIFVQAGVGALAASVAARSWQRWGGERPRIVVVEPHKADALFRSVLAGRPVAATGDLDTVMAGLSCAEVSLLAWEVLRHAADDFLTIPDQAAIDAARLLAQGAAGDPAFEAGETGVAGLAGLQAALSDRATTEALGLAPQSRILLIGSEGITDAEVWQRLTGRAPSASRS